MIFLHQFTDKCVPGLSIGLFEPDQWQIEPKPSGDYQLWLAPRALVCINVSAEILGKELFK